MPRVESASEMDDGRPSEIKSEFSERTGGGARGAGGANRSRVVVIVDCAMIAMAALAFFHAFFDLADV